MARKMLERIVRVAEQGYPDEVCGVLLGRRGASGEHVEDAVAVVNQERDSPATRYAIDPADLVRLAREARAVGREILGYYHSHPDHGAEPSATDRDRAADGLSEGVVHLIVPVALGRAGPPQAWRYREALSAFEREPLQEPEPARQG